MVHIYDLNPHLKPSAKSAVKKETKPKKKAASAPKKKGRPRKNPV